MLQLQFLGGFAAALVPDKSTCPCANSAAIEGFISQKSRALLAYLALEPRPHNREILAELLWSGVLPHRALGNLRVVLSNLRKLVPDYVIIDQDTVAFDATRPFWLDVQAFESAFTDGSVDALRRAVALYRGELLDGVYMRDAQLYDDWVLVERERLRQLLLHSLHRLSDALAARGEYTASIEIATRLLAQDPWREEAHRTLMRLLALTGQRTAALAQYKTCRRMLAEELKLAPLEETVDLYECIRRGTLKVVPVEPALSLNLPLIGRQAEHAALIEGWQAAQQGHGRMMLIAGEAGIGKTRLFEEVARYLAFHGAAVLIGRSYEFFEAVPYQPVVTALRAGLAQNGLNRVAAAVPRVWLAELARLLPEILTSQLDLSPVASIVDQTTQQRLFEAVAQYLLALATKQSIVCFLDDLHWADPSTLDLLHYLVRRLAGIPVWFVGAYRPEETSLNHPLTRLQQGLNRDHQVDFVTLAPLSEAAVFEAAREARHLLIGDAADSCEQDEKSLGRWLFRESEGNPLVLVEMVRALHARNALKDQSNEPRMMPTPTTVRDVILQRVGRLSVDGRALLSAAAVIGRPFDIELLTAMMDQPGPEVAQALDLLLGRRLIVCETACPDNYDFGHDKIRAVVYHATAPDRRRALHRRIGSVLEARNRHELGVVCTELAYHYEQGGDVIKALRFLTMAGERAAGLFMHHEALGYFERAMALAPLSGAQRASLLLKQGVSYQHQGCYDKAAAVWQEVLAITCESDCMNDADALDLRSSAIQAAGNLSELTRLSRNYTAAQAWVQKAQALLGRSSVVSFTDSVREQNDAARLRHILAETECELGHLESAHALFEENLAYYLTQSEPGITAIAATFIGLGNVAHNLGQYAAAVDNFKQALTRFEISFDSLNQALCLRLIGETQWRREMVDEAAAAFGAALDLYLSIDHREGEARTLNGLGLVCLHRGQRIAAREYLEASIAIYDSLGLDMRAAHARHNLGILYMNEGDFARAEACLMRCLETSEATASQFYQALDHGWLGKLLLMRGEFGAARQHLERACALDRETNGNQEEAWHLAWLAMVASEQGDLDFADTCASEAMVLSRSGGVRLGGFESQGLIRLFLAKRNRDAALGLAREVVAEAQANARPNELGMALSMLGAVLTCNRSSDYEDLRQIFERACDLVSDANGYDRGVALRRYGAYLLVTRAATEARSILETAAALLEKVGAAGEYAKVLALLRGATLPELQW